MKGELYNSHLEFFEEAKRAFENNPRYETYRDKDDRYIALRFGLDRDSIRVFELGEEVAFLHNVIDKTRELVLKDE